MKNSKDKFKPISKLMSLALRHDPSVLGIKLDKNGWAQTEQLLSGLNKKRHAVDLELLKEVVENNDKKRFTFSDDFKRIRANQGHSVSIELELKEKEPPHTLYHGTVLKFMDDIMNQGLLKMNRQHVHLSDNIDTAMTVGNRRGKAIILKIDCTQMHKNGYKFYVSENNVWLTDHVPAKYIQYKNA